jgi:hypothetical protein
MIECAVFPGHAPYPMPDTLKIALVRAGRFAGDVPLRTYADLPRQDVAGQLAHVYSEL